MATTEKSLPGLPGRVAGYAATLHHVIGSGHHVASPLGAWLLLALCAPAARDADAATLTELLGCPPAQASKLAGQLLGAPHPLVAAAAAAWGRAPDPAWLAGLPPSVAQGQVPDQPRLDAWAREHTFGLIDRFPLQAGAAYLVLASALATKVSWDCPFELASGSALGESNPWAKRLPQVLRSPVHPAHRAFVASTTRAGDVAVHVGEAQGGLLVVSVIAAPAVAPADVLAAGHEVAIACGLGQPVAERSLLDLPAGDSPLWSVRDEPATDGVRQRCFAVLPAWTATDSYDLGDPRLGFAAAARAVGPGDPWEARQAVTASYSKTGFEAAAATAIAVRMALLPRPGQRRTVELRFGHPYAVIAVTAAPAGPAAPAAVWHGVPVFSAWVAEPRSAEGS